MSITLEENHKESLKYLMQQQAKVLDNFCKLAEENVKKRLNSKMYISVAKQYELEPQFVKTITESLIILLIEACKLKLDETNFCKNLLSMDFTDTSVQTLSTLYNETKDEINKNLSKSNFSFLEYHDLQWRFEVQVASRAALQQTIPLVTMDLVLKDTKKDKDNLEHVVLQTDPNNLRHLVQELEMALQDGRSQHFRKITKLIK